MFPQMQPPFVTYKAAVLELGLAKPVQINTNIVNVGKAKGIKADITSHASVKLIDSSEKTEKDA